jgi:hypothetical protein
LQRHGAFDGADHGPKLDEKAVTGSLNDPPALLRNQRIGSGAMLTQGRRCARFVDLHQPTVADHMGRKDGS